MTSRRTSTPKTQAATADTRASTEGSYRIAAVAKLTGMPVPTIRMWERRYGVVTPARSAANGRLYSRSDIERLTLLKAATDAGHAIGTIAHLDAAQLQDRLHQTAGPRPLSSAAICRVLIYGAALGERLAQAWATRRDIEIIGNLTVQPGQLFDAAVPADAVIVEMTTLQALPLNTLRQLRLQTRARVMIVVYGFGNRQALARLDQEAIIALSAPAEPAHLARICQLGLMVAAKAEAHAPPPLTARRYDETFLATVAQLPTTVRCECPHHLADLLTKLNAFEQYSLECESNDAADASIHSLLYRTAAQCRYQLEQALRQVLAHEGINDPTASPAPVAARP